MEQQTLYLIFKIITAITAVIAFATFYQRYNAKKNEITKACYLYFVYSFLAVLATTIQTITVIIQLNTASISLLPVCGFILMGLASIELMKFTIAVFYNNKAEYKKKYITNVYRIYTILGCVTLIVFFVKSSLLVLPAIIYVLLLLGIYTVLSFKLIMLTKRLNADQDKIFKNKMTTIIIASIICIVSVLGLLIDGLGRTATANPTMAGWMAWILYNIYVWCYYYGFKK